MIRSWCLVLAACTAPAARPQPVPLSHSEPAAKPPPAGMFVADLIARRVDVEDAAARREVRPSQIVLAARARPARAPRIGGEREIITVEYCIDDTGTVTSVRAPGALTPRDRDLVERIHAWRFAPYFVDGTPITACSYLTFESREY